MQRMNLSLACLLCLSWASAAIAQTALESDLGVATLEDYSGGVSYGGAYFDVRTMTGDGVGYRNGFTQIGGLYPIWMTEDLYIAPNARLLVTDNSNVGANLGGLVRKYNYDRDRIFGAYAYYDIDTSSEGFDYQQFMFGVETLGERVDARFNAYFPTKTDDNNFLRPISLSDNPIFFGNSLGFVGQGLFQSAVSGVDFEVGGPLTKRTPWLRGFIGAYAYDADKNDPVGVRARMEAWISNDLSVGVNVTEDKNFGTNVNAVVDFRFAGWNPTRYFPQWTTQERMMMPVQRNWRVATANTQKDVLVEGYNPETGNPYFVVHVDATNPNPGDGTFENPYDNLRPAFPGADLILVQRDGTSLLNPLDGPTTLSNGQRLLGEGRAHTADIYANFFGIVLPTQNYVLPGFMDDGNYPYLTSLGNIVNIASNNEVSAFNMVNAGGNAISNFPLLGSNNFNLNHLNITGNGGGIFLANATGNGLLEEINALNNTAGGISIDSGLLPLNLVANNIISSSLPAGSQAFGMRLTADNGTINANLTNIALNGNTDGLLLDATDNDLNVRIRAAAMNDNLNDGLRITGTNSDIFVDIADAVVNRSGAEGIQAITTGGSLEILGRNITAFQSGLDNVNLAMNNTDMTIDIRNALFTDSVGGSGFVLSNTGGSGGGTLVLETVTATGNLLDGLRLEGTNFTDIDATVAASIFSNNDRDAISVISATSANVDLGITGVFANNSGRHGLNFDAQSGSVLDIGVTLTGMNNSGRLDPLGNGVNGFADAAFVDLTMLATSAVESANNGLALNAVNDAQVSIAINNGNFQNSGQSTATGDAVNITTDTSADVVLQINNTQMNNLPPNATQDDGLSITSDNDSTVLANIANSNLSNNNSNAIETNVDNGASVTVNLQDVVASDSGRDGIRFNVANAGVFNLSANVLNNASNSFDNSGASGSGDGIDGRITTGGVVAFNVFDTTFRNSASNGFQLRNDNLGSSFTGNFTRSNFSDSGVGLNGLGNQDAFNIVATDQSTTEINLLNTAAQNTSTPPAGTQQRGLFGDISSAATLTFNNQSGNMSNNLLHAVDLIIDGTGSEVDLTLFNTPAINSGSHGITVDATNEALLTAVIDSSPLDFSGTDNAGNALDLFFRTGAVGNITLQNGSTATNAGNNAVFIDAANTDTSVTVVALNSDFSDSGLTRPDADGGNGIRVIAADEAFVGLDIRNTPITNTDTLLNTPQQRGLYFDVTTGADLQASFLNSDMSNHSLNGVEGTVDGAGSTAAVVLVDSSLDDNFLNGALLTATDQSLLQFGVGGLTANNSISNNLEWGVNATVNNSTANFAFEGTSINNNGLLTARDGVLIDADNGAVITGRMNNAFLNGNGRNGLFLDLTDSTADFGVQTVLGFGQTGVFNTTLTGNIENGIRLLSSNSTVDYNMVGGTVSNNGGTDGTVANFDNVLVEALAASDVEVQFVQTSANSSTRSGFNFFAEDSTLLAQLRAGVSAQNNDFGNGVRFVATGTGAETAMLYMDNSGLDATGATVTGVNNFSNNGSQVVTVPGGPNADAPLTGAGVFFAADNVDAAAARIVGLVDNNGNAADPIANRDIDGDGDGDHDGIYVSFNTVNTAAFELLGVSTANNNVDEGLDLNITAVGALAPVSLQSDIRNELLTVGNANGSISIENFETNNNAGSGIAVTVVGPTNIDSIYINNVTSNENGADGLLIDLTDVTGAPDLTITNSQFSYNAGNGVNLQLDNSALGNMLVQGNNVGQALAAGTVDFTFDKLIWTTFMDNNAGSTLDIASVSLNIAPANEEWRADLTPFSNGFQPNAGSDVTTGLTTVNGTLINAGTNPLEDNLGNVLADGGVAIGSQLLLLDFTDFNPGEELNYDLYHATVGTDTQGSLAGAIGIITLADGRTATGVHDGNQLQITQVFAQTFPGIAENGLDGIRINQVDSDIASLIIDDNLITNNGTSGTGSAINFEQTTNSDILDLQITNNDLSNNASNGVVMENFNGGALGTAGPIQITGNTISGNQAGDGIRIINPITTNTDLEFAFDQNTITANAGTGVNLNLTNGAQNLVSNFTANTISNNTAGNGVNINLGANANMSGNFGVDGDATQANIISGNSLGGVNVTMAAGTGNFGSNFYGNTISGNTGGRGVSVVLNGSGDITSDFTDNTVATNAQTGIHLETVGAGDITSNFTANTVTGNGTAAVANNNHGINLVMGTAGNFTGNFEGNTVSTNNGVGINYTLAAGSVVTSDFIDNTINGNGSHGINIPLQIGGQFNSANFYGNTIGTVASRNGGLGVRLIVPNLASYDWTLGNAAEGQNLITGNTGAGVGIEMSGNATGSLVATNTSFSNTTGNSSGFTGEGFRQVMNNNATMTNFSFDGTDPGDATARTVAFNGNSGRGFSLEMGLQSAINSLTLNRVQASNNGSDGIEMVRLSDSVLDNVTISNSQINNNSGNGVEFNFQGSAVPVIDLTLTDNEIGGPTTQGNDLNGVLYNLDADVRVNANMSGNVIQASGQSGIRANVLVDATLDGIWDNNTILTSGRLGAADGIYINSNLSGAVGQDTGLTISTSQISGSTRDGIRVETTGASLATIDILNNGPQFPGDVRGITNNTGNGINLLAGTNSTLDVLTNSNLVSNNGASGINMNAGGSSNLVFDSTSDQVLSNGVHGVNVTTEGNANADVTLTDVRVAFNTRRGVSLQNTGNADTNLTITGTTPVGAAGATALSRIEQNGEVGVYVENSATGLNTDNDIVFNLNNTAVIGNGTNASVSLDDRNGVWIRVGTSTSGQVNATVDGNFMAGNGFIDFVTQSFTSTTAALAANSQYTNAGAVVDDPLARLGLIFQNNSGDQVDVTRYGATFTNADAFKSPGALFDSTSRIRNAQRLTFDFPNLSNDTVQAAPAPTTTTFAGTGVGEGAMPNGVFTNLGVTVGANTRDITGYNAGTNVFTVGTLPAAPAAGTNITVFGEDISGLGRSTFRTLYGTIANNAGGGFNDFSNVISNFGSSVATGAAPDNGTILGQPQGFTWSQDATPFTFEP